MATSGSGTMTTLSGGMATGLGLARPLPYTLLSLPRYARIMGIDPLHFSGAHAVGPLGQRNACSDIWYKYSWQNSDQVSLEHLAYTIQSAEQEIASYLGWWPAPVWVSEDTIRYPRVYARDMFGNTIDVRGTRKAVKASYGKVIELGQRMVTLVGAADTTTGNLAYSDEDADGFYETATITVATTYSDKRKLKVFMPGFSGAKEWEIRSPRRVTLSGGNVQFVFDSWLFINPELYEQIQPFEGIDPIDISTVANFVTSVEVYYESVDPTLYSTQVVWNEFDLCEICGGTGCAACAESNQTGCGRIADYNIGLIAPYPATYDAVDEEWDFTTWTYSYDPVRVKMWYYAGAVSNEYNAGVSVEPLSDFFAQIIAWLATARLERPLCACNNLITLSEELRTDLTLSSRDTGSRFVTRDVLSSPFGTRKGEVMAWRRLNHFVKKKVFGAAVL